LEDQSPIASSADEQLECSQQLAADVPMHVSQYMFSLSFITLLQDMPIYSLLLTRLIRSLELSGIFTIKMKPQSEEAAGGERLERPSSDAS
jgi:hypothetical protein